MRIPSAVLLGVLLAGLTLPAAAQPAWDNQLAVTGGAQFATGAFGDAWKTGTGLAVTYYSRPSSRFFFGARVGYQRFKARTGNSTLNVIPLHFASKYNFALTGVQPYLGVDGGLYLLRPDGPDNTSEFGVAPKFGLRFPLASGVDFDVNATYEVILNDPSNQTYLGVNAGFAYIFGG